MVKFGAKENPKKFRTKVRRKTNQSSRILLFVGFNLGSVCVFGATLGWQVAMILMSFIDMLIQN